LTRPAPARASARDAFYRALFFVGLGAFTLLVVGGGVRASVISRLPSLYDASDVFARASELEERGDVAGAAAELSAATYIQPQELSGYERLGFLQGAAGDAEGELATYERAFTHNPLNPRANMVLGLAYMRRERFEEAAARLQAALSLDPHDAMLHTAMGDLLLAQKRYGDAVASFEHALDLDPQQSAIHNKAAIAYAYAGRLEVARQHFERAVELDPSNAEAAGNLRQLLGTSSSDGRP
jgi:Flp pilus assembly protein TadD